MSDFIAQICSDTLNEAIVTELEKIKAEADEQLKYFMPTRNDSDYDLGSYDAYNYMSSIIGEHIIELKGE